MKVVIWCGGRGTRLNEMTELMPKPIIEIGGKPILWHLMKIYNSFGVNEFVLCLGYKGDVIKNYFKNNSEKDFKITFVDTGEDTLTGGRLEKVRIYLGDDDIFMATYGDGLADIDVKKLLEFHKKKKTIATVSGAHPYSKWGMIKFDANDMVTGFWQKPVLTDYINIGFMVFDKRIFDFIKGDVEIEAVLKLLVNEKQLSIFKHEGFFHSMDTYRDYLEFENIWNSKKIPWKTWK